jgi:hypothetical protein
VFVAAGLSLALAPKAMRARPSVRLAYLAYNVVLAGAFSGIYFAATVAQSTALRSFYRWGYWRESFPPWQEPWRLPTWLIGVHTGTTLAYPIGGERGASTATLVALFVGSVVLWRRRRTVAVLLLAPFAIGLATAAFGRYPYGGAPRITQYLAPSICLLAGLGAAELMCRLPSRAWRRRAVASAVALLTAIGAFLIVRDVVEPFRVRSDEVSRRFAREFWRSDGRHGDLVCARSDLGMVFQPKLWKTGMSAVYLFHRGVFAHPRPRRAITDRQNDAQMARPVRVVFFDELPRDNPLFAQWLKGLRPTFQVAGAHDYVVSPGKPGEAWLRERYAVIDLAPADPSHVIVAKSLNLDNKTR